MRALLYPLLLAFCLVLITSPLLAQYNPITETPLEILDKIPVNGSGAPQKTSNPPAATTASSDPDSIQFDPERGIILPEDGSTSSHKASLNPKAHQEDYLLQRLDDMESSPTGNAVVDMNKTYAERQMDELFRRVGGYIAEIGGSYKQIFQYIWKYIKIFVDAFLSISFIADPPPMVVTVPLAAILYGLICYPLRKIAHTITNEEWMAWVFPMQFVLLLKITERSRWYLILLLIPFVNLIFLAVIFSEICEMFKQPSYYGLLILIPGVNIALLWYLAYIEFD